MRKGGWWTPLVRTLLILSLREIIRLTGTAVIIEAAVMVEEERANLIAFSTFVRFVLVWICRFPLPLGVWEGLRFVNVTLSGLFSYLFLSDRGSIGPTMSTATLLNGVSVNGNFHNGTLVTRPFWIVYGQMLEDLQNLVTSPQTQAKRTQPEFYSNKRQKDCLWKQSLFNA